MNCELCGGPLGNLMENAFKYGNDYLSFFIDKGGCPHCWGETVYGKDKVKQDAPTKGLPTV